MLFVGFYLLKEKEKASRRKKPLYKKVLGKEFGAEEFENLYKRFREAFETKNIHFHDTYQWFSDGDSVTFAGSPERQEESVRFSKPIQPKFILRDNIMTLKVGCSQADLASFDGEWFHMFQGCYPFYKWGYPIEKVSKSKRYAERLLKATEIALQSL